MRMRKVFVTIKWRDRSRFKRFVISSLVLLVSIACLFFVLENQQLVALSFFGFSSPQLQVSIFVIGSFLIGAIVGGLLVFAHTLRRRDRGRQVAQRF